MRKIIIFFIIAYWLAHPFSVSGFVMSSPNYRMQSDSLNIGGNFGTSSNYSLEDTIGEIATGDSASLNYGISAGFRAMQDSYLALSLTPNLNLTPAIGSITGGAANGNLAWHVTTDNSNGYTLSIKASSTPALAGPANSNFPNYATAQVNVPDFNWSVPSNTSAFGFSPEGDNLIAKFRDNGSVCGNGNNDTTGHCWYGLSSLNEMLVRASAANQPAGATTTIKFQAESGSTHVQKPGAYSAVITVTALAL